MRKGEISQRLIQKGTVHTHRKKTLRPKRGDGEGKELERRIRGACLERKNLPRVSEKRGEKREILTFSAQEREMGAGREKR